MYRVGVAVADFEPSCVLPPGLTGASGAILSISDLGSREGVRKPSVYQGCVFVEVTSCKLARPVFIV